LKTLAEQTRERVLNEQREVYLPNLKSWERREVHMYLTEDADVISESVGEGRERTLVVKPK
jgi:spoIIIJ-associated protein